MPYWRHPLRADGLRMGYRDIRRPPTLVPADSHPADTVRMAYGWGTDIRTIAAIRADTLRIVTLRMVCGYLFKGPADGLRIPCG